MHHVELPQMGETIIRAEGLSQRTPLRSTYSDVDLDIARGSLCAVVAEDRKGKTELLLTIAGRMKPSSGDLAVAGLALPKYANTVRNFTGMGFIPAVNDVQPLLTLRAIASAELNLHGLKSGRQAVEAYLESWSFGGRGSEKAESLNRFDSVRFGIALGMAGNPAILVVDDIESDLTSAQSASIMGELAQIARDKGTTVVVACTDAELGRHADQAVPISDAARDQLGLTSKETANA